MRFSLLFCVSLPSAHPRFEVFVDLFDEVITPVDWEGGENKRKQGRDGGAM